MGSFSEIVMSFTLRPDLDDDVLSAFSGVPLVESYGARDLEVPQLPSAHEEDIDEYVFYEALEAGQLREGFEPWMYNWEWVLSGGHGTSYIDATTGGSIAWTHRGWLVSFRSTLKSGSEELTYWFGWMGEFAIESRPSLLVGYFIHEYEERPWLVWHEGSGPFSFENLNVPGDPARRHDGIYQRSVVPAVTPVVEPDRLEGDAMSNIAGLEFPAQGAGEVLTGVVGPTPATDHPHLATPLEGLTVADLPLRIFDRSRETDGRYAETFVPDIPPIYVGTTALGLHAVLVAVSKGRAGEIGVGLIRWADRYIASSFHYPTLRHIAPAHRSDSYGWSETYRHPGTWDIHWFPLPAETAHVEFTVEGTVVQSIRPTSRVALVHAVLSHDDVWHLLQGTAYDSTGQPLLVKPPKYPYGGEAHI
jgi:hypothetical protein